ncbi:MAG: helix-turn-helix domain-containing protein [Actinomycetota bacterium]|nr:helix-turn-helix domain-containing protein [Actinomycetota bacterium]
MSPPAPATSPPGSAAERVLDHPRPEDLRLVDVLAALADPVRLGIVVRLAGGEAELSCAALDLPVSKSTSTHHFRVLREAGIVRQRYAGTARLNILRRDDLAAAFPGLLESVLAAATRGP